MFTGVPGIGKSLFLIYFIHRYLADDRFPDKRFAVEFKGNNKYFLFEPTSVAGEFDCSLQDADMIYDKDFLVLCDIEAPVLPAARAKWLCIFSSPNPDRYKETMKNDPTYQYTMPTWSEKELQCVDGDIARWYDQFVQFGGVPRFVLCENSDDLQKQLEEALASKGGEIANKFFTSELSIIDINASNMLVHINPKKCLEYTGTFYSFASDFIFKTLME